MLIALRVGLAKAVQMLILDRWVVDTGFHAEKETGVQRSPERHWLNRLAPTDGQLWSLNAWRRIALR